MAYNPRLIKALVRGHKRLTAMLAAVPREELSKEEAVIAAEPEMNGADLLAAANLRSTRSPENK